MRISLAMIEASNGPPYCSIVAQFRMLQRIPDEGVSQDALRQGRGYGIASQIRALRILTLLDLVTETRSENGEVRFQITDAGRRLARPERGAQ